MAEDLREVTSFEDDSETEAYNAVIDPATATLRIRPGFGMGVCQVSTFHQNLSSSFLARSLSEVLRLCAGPLCGWAHSRRWPHAYVGLGSGVCGN